MGEDSVQDIVRRQELGGGGISEDAKTKRQPPLGHANRGSHPWVMLTEVAGLENNDLVGGSERALWREAAVGDK